MTVAQVGVLVVAVLLVMVGWSAMALCILAKRGEMRAAMWARPMSVDDIIERRKARDRHPAGRAR